MDLGAVARQRVHEPLQSERLIAAEPVQVRMSGFLESWSLLVLEGRQPPFNVVPVGRILIALSPTSYDDPLAGLVWAREGARKYIHQIWVDSDARGSGVGRRLIDAYRKHVSKTVVMSGPFSPDGLAFAKALKLRRI